MAADGRLSFTPSEQVKAYLAELKRIGAYGKKVGDVINFILGKEIMRLIEEGVLQRLPAEVEKELAAGAGDD
jgi:hypothetical protein